MRGHRTYLDAHHVISTRAVKPPLPRGHRKWLNLRPRSKPDRAETVQQGSVHDGPPAESGDAQGTAP